MLLRNSYFSRPIDFWVVLSCDVLDVLHKRDCFAVPLSFITSGVFCLEDPAERFERKRIFVVD